jgi:hypothetical protein
MGRTRQNGDWAKLFVWSCQAASEKKMPRHDVDGANFMTFSETGDRPRIKSEGRPFRDHALGSELQFLARPERDFLARLDLDRLAGCGITSHARGALPYLQDTKTRNADALPLFQMLGDQTDEIMEKNVPHPFR